MVVTILSAVAWMSLGAVNGNMDQVRFEDTRNRLQTIRRAIIGDTSRTLNGQPELRGYVADMGRLPVDLNELIAQGAQPDYSYNPIYGLWAGWNGPYLAAAELVGSPRFQDGWGNNDGTNFGWIYSIYTDSGKDHLRVQSLGKNGIAGGTDVYDLDYPPASTPLISDSEYRVKITESGGAGQGGADVVGGLRVDFGSPDSLPSVELCMVLAFRSGGTIATITSPDVALTWDGTPKEVTFTFEDSTGPTYDEDTYLYQGQVAYGIFEYDSGTGTCDTTKPFPTGATTWKIFTYVPGAVIPPFERKVN